MNVYLDVASPTIFIAYLRLKTGYQRVRLFDFRFESFMVVQVHQAISDRTQSTQFNSRYEMQASKYIQSANNV